MLALYNRERTKTVQWVHTSLIEALSSCSTSRAALG